MRKAYNNKRDANEKAIVKELTRLGCSVQELDDGDGCPDLLVGIRGANYLLEVKAPRTGRLTPDQADWHLEWKGQVNVVTSLEEALLVVGLISSKQVANVLRL